MSKADNYIDRIVSSIKVSIPQLLVLLNEDLDLEVEDSKLKQLIAGRLEIIETIRTLLIRLQELYEDESYVLDVISKFKNAVDKTFDILEQLSKKEITEDNQVKYMAIAKSKKDAILFMNDIVESIKELENKMTTGNVEFRESTFKSSIEQFALDKF